MSLDPVLLRCDNFTPRSRTPWGGRRLRAGYKPDERLAPQLRSQRIVGESWEISVEPDFPSYLARHEDEDATTDMTLLEWIQGSPVDSMGEQFDPSHPGTALLVKLLDADSPLSLQIHPADDYPELAPGEAGKPESWYILEAEPGAGLYLGLAPEVDEAQLRACVEAAGPLERLLRFVPVEPGDFFLIEAGTPHAIGPGLTLVEPQHVRPGQRGVTYRYWDWNRRYNGDGFPDPAGQPRPLHLEHALRVTDWERVRRDDFLASIRLRTGPPKSSEEPVIMDLCGPSGALHSDWLQVQRLAGTGPLRLPASGLLRGLTVVEGHVTLPGSRGPIRVDKGCSAVIPAACKAPICTLEAAHALLTAIPARPLTGGTT